MTAPQATRYFRRRPFRVANLWNRAPRCLWRRATPSFLRTTAPKTRSLSHTTPSSQSPAASGCTALSGTATAFVPRSRNPRIVIEQRLPVYTLFSSRCS